MFVVEVFVPLAHSDGKRIAPEVFDGIKSELTERFGGVTAFLRAPAEGQWKPHRARPVISDQVAIYEVMVRDVDTSWWGRYRRRLERDLGQEQVLVRLHQVTLL